MDHESIPAPSKIDGFKKKYGDNGLIWGFVSVEVEKSSKTTKRINITIPENILSKIDAYAQKEGESRSGFLASAAIEYIAHHSLPENG